jgi:hypothetical protein
MATTIPKAFLLEGTEYLKVTPSKSLFRSTLVHEVVNRGDVFAIRLHDQMLMIIPGTAKVVPIKMAIHHSGDYRIFEEVRQSEIDLTN